MHQTMLALLGMMLVTMMSVSQQRALLETRRAMVNDELEVMASGVALQTMEYIGSKSFDASLVGQNVPASQPVRLVSSGGYVANLSEQIPSGKACTVLSQYEDKAGFETCDDLSDFNEMEPQSIPFEVGDETVSFSVSATVRYVDGARLPLESGTSKHKEVVVQINKVSIDGKVALLPQPIALSRIFSIP